jgi:hypothetical protein
MANKLSCTEDEVLARLKDRYDGYHFSENTDGIFNPFSLLNAFKANKLGSYWFASGTPRALVEMLKKYKRDGKFDVEMLDNLEPVSPAKFESPLEMQTGPIPLLYQAGYVTIKGYDEDASVFVLGVPNSEVRVGLMENLLH